MAVRCYIPTTLTALDKGLDTAIAVAPDTAVADLRPDDAEESEFAAMSIAASLAATEALGAEPPSPRVVVAYDAPETVVREPLTDGFDLLTLETVETDRIASFHLDEAPVWDDAVHAVDVDAVEDLLGDSDLLWYDRSELGDLLRERR